VAATAGEDGSIDAWLVEPGAVVVKGQPLAALHLGPGGERLGTVMDGLLRNTELLRGVSVSRGLPAGLESGAMLDYFPDASVRERAAALEESLRKLTTALRGRAEFAGPRDEAISAGLRLSGAVTEYLERHTVRAPASGTLLQYEGLLHAFAAKGSPVATVLPRGARLVARLIVDPRHAAGLAVGQNVRYKLDAFPYQRYGLFEGKVLVIERTTDALLGLRYVVRASIAPPPALPRRLASDIRLMVGMQADGRIVLGRRRLFDLAAEELFGKR
jgi:multidrug efflux pump subunit AcrA (membrane-fusion protein)